MNTASTVVDRVRLRDSGARRGGFVLRDLVTLAAVTVLAVAIFAPAISHALLTPGAMVCQSSLRAIGVAHMLYADDNDDCLTVARADYQITVHHWFNLLSGYAGQQTGSSFNEYPTYYGYPEVFKGCPDYDYSLANAWNPGYGVVYTIYDVGTGDAPAGDIGLASINVFNEDGEGPFGQPYRFHRRAEMAYPSQRGWQGDSDAWYTVGDPYQTASDPANRIWPYWAGPENTTHGFDPQRHGDAANYLFIDMHVESLGWEVSGHAFGNYTKLLDPGDYNGDGQVDTVDYVQWADSYGRTGNALVADGNRDGEVNQPDYTIWADRFGTAPLTATQSSTPAATEQTAEPQEATNVRQAIGRRKAEMRAARATRSQRKTARRGN